MSSRFLRTLDRIEALGNRLPPPAWLFVWLCGLVLVASAIAAGLGWQETWPDGSKTISAVNLLSLVGLNHLFNDTVTNFTGFAPVGNVLVAMLGLGWPNAPACSPGCCRRWFASAGCKHCQRLSPLLA